MLDFKKLAKLQGSEISPGLFQEFVDGQIKV